MTAITVEIVPATGYVLDMGYRIDGSVVRFWALKSDAVKAAKSIGWPVNAVTPVHTRFCRGYALSTEHKDLLTKDSFAALYYDRNGR